MGFRPWRWRLVLAGLMGVTVLSLGLWLADLLGVSKSLINGFFLVVSIIGYAVIGMFCRTGNPEEYYVAGRRVSAPFNGMATAADWMSAASFIGLTGLLLSDGFVGDGHHAGGLAYVLGWTGGFCLLGFLFAAKLNASSAITIPDFLGQRFQSPSVRWLAAWGAILCSSIYLIAQIYGIGLVASMLSGLTFELGVFLALGGILLCSFLGGMRAVTWTQVVQCVVIVASMLALGVAVSWKTQGHPVLAVAAAQSLQTIERRAKEIEADPAEQRTRQAIALRIRDLDSKIADPVAARTIERQVIARQIARAKADNAPLREIQALEANPAWREVGVERLTQAWWTEREQLIQTLNRPVGFQAADLHGLNQGWVNTVALVFCLMVGTAALPHVLVRSYTASSPTQAQRSVVWALFFIVVVYLCASALAVLIKSFVLTELVGVNLDQLPDWADRLKLRKLALLTVQDYNHDGIVQFSDVRLFNDYVVLAVPEIARLSPVFTGLIAAGALAAALSTADGLLLTISNALAQDLYFQTAAPQAPALRRVMLSKILLMVVALLAAWFATNRPVNILFWITCAFSLAASTFFPVLLLGLYWPAMNRVGAIAAMASGLGVSFYYIVSNHPWVQMRLQLSPQDTIWWGLDPTCAAVFGVPMGLFLGYVFSQASASKN
ncbi:VC_2705 family sodium/solute symporter [Limnohabitans sp. JirII-31]|uniref:VC_2705 family sodium/solute symporter n=1 Tax=Limnohabitans sp. JirII-31 TaxID=1977908 RepID=UPI001E62FCBB|nr:VC_2705 family sodium/solute symporter [Limnohabitans sp. JirII-31]